MGLDVDDGDRFKVGFKVASLLFFIWMAILRLRQYSFPSQFSGFREATMGISSSTRTLPYSLAFFRLVPWIHLRLLCYGVQQEEVK